MEVIRNVPADRPHIQRYRGGGFAISGVRYNGSVLVTPARATTWPEWNFTRVDAAALVSALADAKVGLCLFGCGERMAPVPVGLRQALKEAGIAADSMITAAACRTFNMMMGEGRTAAALLSPLP